METETNQNLEGREKNTMGPLIGSIIVIVILIIGAIYVWGNKMNKEVMPEVVEQSNLTPLSTSNEVEDLENDMLNTPDVKIDTENL